MKRSARKLAEPDLGVLAARLLFEVQGEIFRGTAEQGFDDVRPRHGAVLAYLDMPTLGQPEVFLQHKEGLFDDKGHVAEGSKQFLQGWVDKYVAWINDHAK